MFSTYVYMHVHQRYATEDMARAVRTGRITQPSVPAIALGLAREEAVGPRGERPEAAAEMKRRETEGEVR